VIAFPLKKRMRLDVQYDKEISGRAAAPAGLAVAHRPQARVGVDPGRDLKFDASGFLGATCTVALTTRLVDTPPGALATRTRLGDAENAPRRHDLAATVAGLADLPGRAFLRTGTAAALAGFRLGHRNFPLAAVGRLLELEFQIVAQIGA